MSTTVLVTGAAGFIGMHVALALLARGARVVGVDNLNDYYDPDLKRARLDQIQSCPQAERFQFYKCDIADAGGMEEFFRNYEFDSVIHLAAQAGVRYSLTNPSAYIDSNIVGFLSVLQGMREQRERFGDESTGKRRHLVYASSSSVYGGNKKLPFSEIDNVDHPVSLYAATKRANELMAHTYAHLFNIPATGLRFFTVYGPWGRPDMAPFIFSKSILAGDPITVFNEGKMQRDFTYIDDIVEGILGVIDKPPVRETGSADFAFPQTAPHRVLNIGHHRPENLIDFIDLLEHALGVKAKRIFAPIQPGDVPATFAEIESLQRLTGFSPKITLSDGINRFVDWYRRYYAIK